MSATINATTTSGLVLGPDNSGSIQLQNNGTTKLTVDSTGAYGQLTQGTALAYNWNGLTTNTYLDFTGIPAWAKRITVIFNGVSTNGSSQLLIQTGSGSIVSSGYVSNAWSNNASVATSMAGFILAGLNSATGVYSGHAILTKLSSTVVVQSSVIGSSVSNNAHLSGGSVTIGGDLDRVRITTVGSADYFDAGSINILYEG